MDKLFWVSLPVLVAAAAVVVLWWRQRLPSRHALNVWFSLLLMVYLLITAGLGIFWVANQHLPVFDWHYLFGYLMLVLLVLHLAFNLRTVWQHLRRPRPAAARAGVAAAVAGRRSWLGAFSVFGFGSAAGIGYWIGLRHGRTELRIDAAAAGTAAGSSSGAALALAVVEQFHGFSAHTRSGVLRRAPGADWGDPPPPFKSLPAGQRLVLPAPRTASSDSSISTSTSTSGSTSGSGSGSGSASGSGTAGALNVASLADMLWHTAGVSARSGGIAFRTSPSSGALFATELYVAVRDITGVPPGLWHYDVPAHALVALAAGPVDPASLGTGNWPADTAALLFASGIFRRSGHKYRDRTYRYVLGDLGHALENLRAVAGAAGAKATLLPAFDEARIAAALRLDEAQEGVLAALLLQPGGAAELQPLRKADWRPAPLAAVDGAALGITEAIHRATSLRAAGRPTLGGRSPVTSTTAIQTSPPASLRALPVVAASAVDPLRLIARRRSIRRYSNQLLSLQDLAAVLAAMGRGGPVLSDALRIDFIAQAVESLEPGAWRYHPQQHAIELRAQPGGKLRSRSGAAALAQDVIGDAAAVFVLSIDRAAFTADPTGAARGYRHAFLEAGLVGERVYLEGTARGLGVCGVGAFYDDEVSALIGVDPEREWVVHLAALGRVSE